MCLRERVSIQRVYQIQWLHLILFLFRVMSVSKQSQQICLEKLPFHFPPQTGYLDCLDKNMFANCNCATTRMQLP